MNQVPILPNLSTVVSAAGGFVSTWPSYILHFSEQPLLFLPLSQAILWVHYFPCSLLIGECFSVCLLLGFFLGGGCGRGSSTSGTLQTICSPSFFKNPGSFQVHPAKLCNSLSSLCFLHWPPSDPYPSLKRSGPGLPFSLPYFLLSSFFIMSTFYWRIRPTSWALCWLLPDQKPLLSPFSSHSFSWPYQRSYLPWQLHYLHNADTN